MRNVRFASIDDYRDLESLNLYRERTEAGVPAAEMMEGIYQNGRDNARTPMPWDGGVNAGFSSGTPWLKLNPDCDRIHVAAALADPDSIFYYYQRLIRLRKESEVLVYGDYLPLLEAHAQVFAYLRRLGPDRLAVVCNFAGDEVALVLPPELAGVSGRCLISNDAPRERLGETLTLRPYEAFMLAWRTDD
jgi:oligo-1,6-glucosidase